MKICFIKLTYWLAISCILPLLITGILQGEPIEGASFFAVGGEGNDSGFSNDEGKCVLTMVINSEYKVYIEAEKFQRIIFDIEVIGDQTFNFHMKEEKTNQVFYQSFLYQFLSKIINKLIL